jgi:hypothetical protein
MTEQEADPPDTLTALHAVLRFLSDARPNLGEDLAQRADALASALRRLYDHLGEGRGNP